MAIQRLNEGRTIIDYACDSGQQYAGLHQDSSDAKGDNTKMKDYRPLENTP